MYTIALCCIRVSRLAVCRLHKCEMSLKWKKVAVSMDKKLDALIDKGEPLENIADEFGVRTSMVSNWKIIRSKLKIFALKMIPKDSLEDHKTIRNDKNESLDYALYIWFSAQTEHRVPLSRPILQERRLF